MNYQRFGLIRSHELASFWLSPVKLSLHSFPASLVCLLVFEPDLICRCYWKTFVVVVVCLFVCLLVLRLFVGFVVVVVVVVVCFCLVFLFFCCVLQLATLALNFSNLYVLERGITGKTDLVNNWVFVADIIKWKQQNITQQLIYWMETNVRQLYRSSAACYSKCWTDFFFFLTVYVESLLPVRIFHVRNQTCLSRGKLAVRVTAGVVPYNKLAIREESWPGDNTDILGYSPVWGSDGTGCSLFLPSFFFLNFFF